MNNSRLIFDYYHVALYFFIALSLVLIGFFLAAMKHAPRLVAVPRAWRIIILGRIINSAFLAFIAYRATEISSGGEIRWEYWVVVGGALITLIGLIDAVFGYRDVEYGRRWSDYYKRSNWFLRRDDNPPQERRSGERKETNTRTGGTQSP